MPDASPETSNMARWAISIAVPAISGFMGILIGAWISSKQQKEQAKLSFVEKQLKYFYSPLLGTISEIIILNKIEMNISGSANAEWKKRCEEARKDKDINYNLLRENRENDIKEYVKIIDYNNQQLTESLLPSYHHMVSIFKEYYYLADPNICEYLYPLIEFVNLRDRWLKKTIPTEVLTNLGHNESALLLFYKEVEEIHDKLRMKLENGKA